MSAPAQPDGRRAIDPGAAIVGTLEPPAPQEPFDPARRTAPQQVDRVDHEERDQHRDEHVAGDRDCRREQAEQRQIGAHAADVDGEQRRDERPRPCAIDRRARPFGRVDRRDHRHHFGLCGEAELGDDRFITLRARVDRLDEDAPRDAEDAQRAGDRDGPGQEPSPREQNQQDDNQIADDAQRRRRALPGFAAAHHGHDAADGIDRKPSRDHDPQCLRGQKRRVDQEERDRHADHAAGRAGAARGRRRSPERMEHFHGGRKREQRADPRRRIFGAAERRRQREQPECAGDGREPGWTDSSWPMSSQRRAITARPASWRRQTPWRPSPTCRCSESPG